MQERASIFYLEAIIFLVAYLICHQTFLFVSRLIDKIWADVSVEQTNQKKKMKNARGVGNGYMASEAARPLILFLVHGC